MNISKKADNLNQRITKSRFIVADSAGTSAGTEMNKLLSSRDWERISVKVEPEYFFSIQGYAFWKS